MDSGFFNGRPHSGSYVFLRSDRQLTDALILDALGLGDFQPADALFDGQGHVVIGNSATWTVVADDFDWGMFHLPSEFEVLAPLVASEDEVFLCRLPDTDDGFDFFYWRNGVVVRSYQKRSPDWGHSFTIREEGKALAAESLPLDGRNEPIERVWAIARSLGFDLADSAGSYRVFGGPVIRRAGFDGPFITNIPRKYVESPILGPRLRWRRS